MLRRKPAREQRQGLRRQRDGHGREHRSRRANPRKRVESTSWRPCDARSVGARPGIGPQRINRDRRSRSDVEPGRNRWRRPSPAASRWPPLHSGGDSLESLRMTCDVPDSRRLSDVLRLQRTLRAGGGAPEKFDVLQAGLKQKLTICVLRRGSAIVSSYRLMVLIFLFDVTAVSGAMSARDSAPSERPSAGSSKTANKARANEPVVGTARDPAANPEVNLRADAGWPRRPASTDQTSGVDRAAAIQRRCPESR